MKPVLIVDDDKAVRDALRFSLEVEGFRVQVYASAEALLNDATVSSNGCLVVDQLMPVMTGLELVRVLRQRQCFVAAILITTHADRDLRRRAALVGFQDVLEKPLEGGRLIECIREAMNDG